ncbi:MAG: hypothetical protein FWC73_14400 [Defluviitaleaceae bacterium]|nr:hypothetical protein [Defluviitaleaceae bacterium]
MQIKTNWEETRQRFTAWWAGQSTGRPLLHIWTKREHPIPNNFSPQPYNTVEERYLNAEKITANYLDFFANHEPRGEGYPEVSLNLGAGSLALYVGSQPTFSKDTIWFEPVEGDYNTPGYLGLDPQNHWYKTHLDMHKKAKEMLKGTDALLSIPDIVEHLDILSSLRGTEAVCLDFYDFPEEVKSACKNLNRHYETCFDALNEYCIDETGGNSFTAFNIWGPGRTAKVQADIAAMLSPELFREFGIPAMKEQCGWLDNSLFHLDGPECICHVPALMEMEELNALQWTPGYSNPSAGEEIWDDMYAKVKDAGKGLWVSLYDYGEEAVDKADRLVRKFGAQGFYFIFPHMERVDAEKLLIKAEREWKC